MSFELPKLTYEKNALEPHISQETLEYHYDKHHQAYVTNLNKLIAGTEFENSSLEEIIKRSQGGIFNNAAQVWNHSFYWNCLSPDGGSNPQGKIAELIDKNFGSFTTFKENFTKTAIGLFGSGWVFLTQDTSGNLEICACSNANTPMTENKTAILTCDVWEHAYYIDYKNLRPKYLENFWNLVNWSFAQSCLK
jgi:superoxide dismutase, Fe-Mn family